MAIIKGKRPVKRKSIMSDDYEDHETLNTIAKKSEKKVDPPKVDTEEKKLLTELHDLLINHQTLVQEALKVLEEECIDDLFFVGKINSQITTMLNKINKVAPKEKKEDPRQVPPNSKPLFVSTAEQERLYRQQYAARGNHPQYDTLTPDYTNGHLRYRS